MVIKISTEPIREDRVDLFELGGKMYTMPAEVPGSLALEAMEIFRRQGDAAASAWLLKEVIGEEAYGALRTCKTLRKEDLQAIQKIVSEHVFGSPEGEGEEGKSDRKSVV